MPMQMSRALRDAASRIIGRDRKFAQRGVELPPSTKRQREDQIAHRRRMEGETHDELRRNAELTGIHKAPDLWGTRVVQPGEHLGAHGDVGLPGDGTF